VKRILCLSILGAACAWADDAGDREAIERVIAAVNNHSKPLTDVFTADAPESERSMLSAHEEPWSEITSSRITIRSIRLIAPQIALVESMNTQYGSVIVMRSAPMLLVMKKDGAQWRIACVLTLPDSAGVAMPSPVH
jgi:hypothetical protein